MCLFITFCKIQFFTGKNSTYAQALIKLFANSPKRAEKEEYRFFQNQSAIKKHVNSMKSVIIVSYLPVVWFGEPLFLSCTTSTHIGMAVWGNYSVQCFSQYSCFLSSICKRAPNHRPKNRRQISSICNINFLNDGLSIWWNYL